MSKKILNEIVLDKMDNRLAQLVESKESLVRIFKKLQWVFFAALGAYCAVMVAIFVYSLLLPSGYEYIGPDSVISLLPIICNVIAGGLVLFVLGIISRAIGKGASPFTFRISVYINVLALFLLISFVVTLFIHPGTQVGAVGENAVMAIEYDGNPNEDINFDVKTLLASIVCFAMSAVFRYGAILQIEADDLV